MGFIICGFMGSGKTTLIEELKRDEKTGTCFDLDSLILDQLAPEFKGLGEYIRQAGWDSFRERESKALCDVLSSLGHRDIVALGGGTLEREENILKIQKSEHILVGLDTPFELCLRRIKGDRNRPMLDKRDEELREIYLKRCDQYKKSKILLKPEQIEQVKSLDDLFHFLNANDK
ncbi:shikimate kinase [Halobacteriovorax sp. GB3]|uniref:shikimate kinase n=1 Tax=Halobacteriovorax sp. GB3 TaxID=2719615 RepID=UPI002360E50F|nr:shikimate kinase [Halobacteriovorax sp. GB3]MDD0853954.1 shikimate kinase [Halobacteriovorax sp. GB3]